MLPDYDMCEGCFPRRDVNHPGHEFMSFKTPRRIVVHRVYDGDETPRLNNAPVPSSNAVHGANCDLCDSRIRGVRYVSILFPGFAAIETDVIRAEMSFLPGL